MKPADIHVGDTLRLKPVRASDYGLRPDARIVVHRIYCRNGYATPWIASVEGDVYRPSDFLGKANGDGY